MYPNPAQDYIAVEFYPENPSDNGIINFYNMNGVLISSISLNNQSSSIILSTTDFTSGVYLYKFTLNNALLESGKLSIIK